MACKCGHEKLVAVNAKCSDTFCADLIDTVTRESICLVECSYVPGQLNIGAGDYVRFKFCPNCGTIQGSWPVNLQEEE